MLLLGALLPLDLVVESPVIKPRNIDFLLKKGGEK